LEIFGKYTNAAFLITLEVKVERTKKQKKYSLDAHVWTIRKKICCFGFRPLWSCAFLTHILPISNAVISPDKMNRLKIERLQGTPTQPYMGD